MNKFIIIFGILMAACSPQVDQASDPVTEDITEAKDQVIIGERLSMHSDILDEDRPYWVHLPDSYDGDKKYPVLYLLDGDAHFKSVVGAINFMSAGINGNTQTPELIVVAIPNTNRMRDLSQTPLKTNFDGSPVDGDPQGGGGDNFLKFIETELIPKIEGDYKTMPHRTFVGHSLGGLIALHSFVTQPGLYDGYIAIDPSVWWDGAELLTRSQDFLSKAEGLKGRIFITAADHDPEEAMLLNINGYNELLESLETDQLQIDFKLFKGEDHGSVPLVSLYYGLLHVFDGFKLNQNDAMKGADVVKEHYVKISKMMNEEYLPPEGLIGSYGNFFSTQEDGLEKAMGFMELNVANYPESSSAYSSLAGVYNKKGETDLAQQNYQRALELDPENEAAIEGLKVPEDK